MLEIHYVEAIHIVITKKQELTNFFLFQNKKQTNNTVQYKNYYYRLIDLGTFIPHK